MSETIEEYAPIKTSKYISIYELAKVLTDLSLYLYESKSVSKYIEDLEVNTLIEPNRLAYELLKNGTFDAVIDRGYEKVTFSKLKINPVYDDLIVKFLDEQEHNINHSFLELLNLINKDQK